jgi:hypothetical protein
VPSFLKHDYLEELFEICILNFFSVLGVMGIIEELFQGNSGSGLENRN